MSKRQRENKDNEGKVTKSKDGDAGAENSNVGNVDAFVTKGKPGF